MAVAEGDHRQKRLWGCLFDPHGAKAVHRSRFAMMSQKPAAALPPHVDLRMQFPPITNQQYNNCTSEALVAAYEFTVMAKLGKSFFIAMSRLFLYYQERLIEGTTRQDNGAMIHSGILALMTAGVCAETTWPYKLPSVSNDISAVTTRPGKQAYNEALQHKVDNAMLVEQNLDTIKGVISSGHPVVIGFLVYPSMETASVDHTGIIPMPSAAELRGEPLGGHAILLVGYDDSSANFILRNSWGTSWGDKGYGYMPYQYVTNTDLCQDIWVISSVNEEQMVVPVPPAPPTPTPAPPVPPTPTSDCCATCDPSVCCCARTRGKKLPFGELKETLVVLTQLLQRL